MLPNLTQPEADDLIPHVWAAILAVTFVGLVLNGTTSILFTGPVAVMFGGVLGEVIADG